MNGKNQLVYTITRVRKGVKAKEPEEMGFQKCPLCGAIVPVKTCDECSGKELIHVCAKDGMNGEGINTYFYHCDCCKKEWFMKLIIIKKQGI